MRGVPVLAARIFKLVLRSGSVFLLLVCFLFPTFAHSQDYFSPQNILKFADYLYRQQDYLRAAAEYQRYLETISPKDSVFYTLGLAYKRAKKWTAAERAFEQIPARFGQSALRPKAYLQLGFLWVLQNDTARIRNFQQKDGLTAAPVGVRQPLETIFGVPLLLNHAYPFAKSYFQKLDRPNFSRTERPFVQAFEKLAVAGEKLNKKKPVLAGALSAIVPGLGRFYAGRPGDGLYSMIFIGISGYSAYRGFARHGLRSGRGWVLGGLTTALYLGNVYGSYLSAKIMNEKKEHDFRTQVVLQLDLWHSAHHLGRFIR